MLLLPVMQREMLVEARRPLTAHARLFMPLLGLAAFMLFAMSGRFDETTGSRLLYSIQPLFFASIWCVIPLLTADALSQERRENTLGLLFLTGLSGRDIVLGKSCTHALRGLNLLLAMIPFQIVPVVLGGVTWTELVVAGLVNVAAILLALAAGMLASAVSRSWWRALPLALLFGVLFMVGLSTVLFLSHPANYVRPAFARAGGVPGFSMDSALANWLDVSWAERLTTQLAAISSPHLQPAGSWGAGWMLPNLPQGSLVAATTGLLVAGATAGLLLGLAARIISASWAVRPPSARTMRWQRYWFSARFLRSLLQRRLAGALNRNPVGWLHQRSWKSRLLKWSWFLLVAVIAAQLLQESMVGDQYLPVTLRLLGVAMLMSVAFTAATSFRHDLESGTLELLLVSPLPAQSILSGRFRGIVSQYVPAFALLLFVWLAVFLDLPQRFFRLRGVFHWGEALWFASTTLTVIATGIHQSLQQRAVLWAWLGALIHAWLLPVLIASAGTLFVQMMLPTEGRQLHDGLGFSTWFAGFLGSQVLVAIRAWYRTAGLLARREWLSRLP